MSSSAVLFGRYRLVEQLGAGGMARVFRAVVDGPKGFARELVLKRIRPEYSRNPHFVNMLAAEARLCGLLRHPNIVQVHEFGEVGGDYYLAMELVEGHDLLTLTRALSHAGRRLPVGIACHIINELASALDYAHALSDGSGRSLELVHRDVSPSNIMIGALGTVKLFDFGIAKAAAHVRDEHTHTGTLKGKIGYMSPEQAEGLALDGRSDLFALGVVFWEILTQQRLFRGEGELERLRMVREAKVQPPSTLVPGLPPVIDAIVMRLLARQREQRYQRGAELMAALTPLASHAAALRQLVAELKPHFPPRNAGAAAGAEARGLPDSLPVGIAAAAPEEPATRAEPAAAPMTLSGAPSLTGAASRGELLSLLPETVRASSWRSMRRWLAPAAVGAALGLVGVGAGGSAWWRMSAASKSGVAGAATATVTATAKAEATTIRATEPTAAAAPADLPVATPPEVAHETFATEPVTHTTVAVRLRVGGPEHAEVIVDGRLLGHAPLEVALDAVDGERQLVVQKPGFAPWTRKIAGDITISLTPKLQRKRGAEPARRRGDDVYDPFGN